VASLKSSELRDAAARVSSGSFKSNRGVAGVQNVDEPWAEVQAKIARSLVSDPDTLIYMAYLCSNKASAVVREVLELLEDLILAVEGMKYTQPSPSSPARLQRMYSLTSRATTPSAAQLEALRVEGEKHLAEELIPAVSLKGRLQKRGGEASSAYGAAKADLLKKWPKMLKFMRRCSEERRMNTSVVGQTALSKPLESLGKTLEVGYTEEDAADYTVQLAAALAAIRAMGREFDVRYRVRLDDTTTFPEGVSAEATYEDGAVSFIDFGMNPKELAIRSGDAVLWGGGEATVLLVQEDGVTLADSTITQESGRLQVSSAAYLEWEVMADQVSTLESSLPTASVLKNVMRRKEGSSAAEIRDLAGYLAGIYALLDSVPREVQSALTRLGTSVEDEDSTALSVLDAFDPTFSAKTVKTGDGLLDALEDGGFDYGADLLLQGNVNHLFGLEAQRASKLSRVSEATAVLSGRTGGVR